MHDDKHLLKWQQQEGRGSGDLNAVGAALKRYLGHALPYFGLFRCWCWRLANCNHQWSSQYRSAEPEKCAASLFCGAEIRPLRVDSDTVALCRYPGHVLPVTDLMSTGAEGGLEAGIDLLEWGTTAFSEMACTRPLYLQVTCAQPAARHRCL